MGCERSFIPMKLIRLAYLVFGLCNCVMKLCIETGLTLPFSSKRMLVIYCILLYVEVKQMASAIDHNCITIALD